tara:strand:- start:2779 stop:3243 length:465 start_codon:yes stop_codon:yes gene_type:complete
MDAQNVDLSEIWPAIVAAGLTRDRRKKNYQSADYRNDDSAAVGVAGEYVYALFTDSKVDLSYKPEGDGGMDFPGVDVKTSTFPSDPHLKLFEKDFSKPAERFVLVALCLQKRQARLVGWISKDDAKQVATRRDYGYGNVFSIGWQDLQPMEALA